MKLLRICLFVWLAFAVRQPVSAQSFSKLYIQGRPSMLFGSIKTINNQLYVTGVTTTVRSPNYTKALFGKISGAGDVTFINSIADSANYNSALFLNSLKICADGNFITTGYEIKDTVYYAFLMKTDTNGNILLWHEYTETGNLIYQGMDVAEVLDSGYLLAVNIDRDDYTSSILILRTDILGNVISQYNYYGGQQAMPYIIRPMFNGHYMLGAYTDEQGTQTPYWSKTWLLEVDMMGNLITDWVDTSKKNLYPNGVEQTADSGWIIVRQHVGYDVSNYQAYNGSILKLDKNFNKEWEIDTGGIDFDAGMFDVKILSDGSYICVGTDAVIITPDSSLDYGWILKVSSTGEILWWRDYLADSTYDAFNYLNSITLMPDGGFASCGRIESNDKGQQGWIIRTDSDGCLLDNCGRLTTEIEEINNNQLTAAIFPNPSKRSFTIKLSIPPDDGVYLNVYDITGRLSLHQLLAQQTTTIPNRLSAGMYLWQVQSSGGGVGGGKLVVGD